MISILIPAFELPISLLKTVITILIIGFPIWLIFSWVYDITPEGLKKTEDLVFNEEIAASKNLKLNRIIIGALSVAIVLLVYNQFRLKGSYEAEIADMVVPDDIYNIYKQITSKPHSMVGLETVCSNPWIYTNLIKDANFIKEVKQDGRFVDFLKLNNFL